MDETVILTTQEVAEIKAGFGDDFDVEVNALCDTIKSLRAVCAEAYQLAGALGAPVKALDNLSAAASGRRLPHETFLPVIPQMCE